MTRKTRKTKARTRATKAGRVAAEMAREAARVAALLSAAPAEQECLAPPAFIAEATAAGALAVWREYAPVLAARNMLEPIDRHTFALFCWYCAEFVQACEDIRRNGYSREVATIAGGNMLRENPAVARRDSAQKIVLDMSRRFGLTPLDRATLAATQKRADYMPPADELPLEPTAEAEVAPEAKAWAALLDQPATSAN
jgi:P27 family predicted phage terminase small subunit